MAEMWPTGIQYADLDWSSIRQENVIRFTPERGPSKVRRVSTKAYETLSITLTLTPAQSRAFRYWYRYDLNDGVNTFFYPDFLDDSSMREARFKAAPQFQRNGDAVVVSAQVELL